MFRAGLGAEHVAGVVGFALGCAAAMLGALLTALAVASASFWLLCLGTLVFGFYNAAGQYLRFAAVDLAAPGRQARALSLVLAGGRGTRFYEFGPAEVVGGLLRSARGVSVPGRSPAGAASEACST